MFSQTTPQAESRHVVFVLNTCIEVCMDREKGYAAAAADVRNPSLKALLHEKSKERAGFVLALQSAIEERSPRTKGPPAGRHTADGWIYDSPLEDETIA